MSNTEEKFVIELTLGMIDELAQEAPDVDADKWGFWIGYRTVMATPCASDHVPVTVVPAAAVFRREQATLADGSFVNVWNCDGRLYRGGVRVA